MARQSNGPRTRVHKLIRSLEAAARRRGLTKAEIAIGAQVHPNTLRKFDCVEPTARKLAEVGAWNPKAETLARLEQFLLPPLS